jgi:hypothetical protein
MNTWPNRGACGGPCGGLMKKDSKTEQSGNQIQQTTMV